MQRFAAARGGTHVGTFVSTRTKTEFMCSLGHRFSAKPSNIQQGQWCRQCVIDARRLRIDQLQALAAMNDGILLSVRSEGADVKHAWRCAEGHEFWQTPTDVKGGHWCNQCAGNRPLTIGDLRLLARQKGWVLLSEKYEGCQKDHLWRCPKGHEVKKQPNNLRFSDCRQCSAGRHASKGQLFVLEIARSVVPDLEVRGSELGVIAPYELDVYVPSLHKGIEFDGTFFHSLAKQQKRDLAKDRLCRERGISLLRISEKDYLEDPQAVRERVESFLAS
jgi:hypothetical protein